MSRHDCTYYCQDGLHVYECLCPLAATAADVWEAAQHWAAYLGYGDVVVRVAPGRETDPLHILEPTMLEVWPEQHLVRDVQPTGVDVSQYRPWLVWLREGSAEEG
jgi:hypothetical protein